MSASNRSGCGIGLVSLLVHSYDEAIAFFTEKLAFTLTEDSPSFTNAGVPKRWVVVHPPDTSSANSGILLAQADGPEQIAMVGKQFAGRVGLFWRVEDFAATFARLIEADVEFITQPQTESFGRYAVFLDIAGNKWDLIGAAS